MSEETLGFLGVAVAFAATLAFTPVVRSLARRWGMVTRPRADRWAKKPTALLGGVAVFGLPNQVHAARCDEKRDDVEAALAGHFGRPIPLRIVVDGDAATPGAASGGAPPDETPDDLGADIDMDQLTDAEDTAVSGIDRIAEAFPGVEVVESE